MKLKILLLGIAFAILGFPVLIAIFAMVSFQQLPTETITAVSIEPPVQVPARGGTVLIDVAFDIDRYYVNFPFTTLSNNRDNLTVSFENLADTQVTITLEELTTSGHWSEIHSFTTAMGPSNHTSSTIVRYRDFIEASDEDLTNFRVTVESLRKPLAGILIVSQQENF